MNQPRAPMDAAAPLAVDPALDPRAMAPALKRFGRIHIPGFLDTSAAARVHAALAAESEWVRSTRLNGAALDLTAADLAALTAEQQGAMDRAGEREAQAGFHYRFDTVRFGDAVDAGRPVAPAYAELFAFLNGPAFLGFMRALTGEAGVVHADAQATRYGPGDYLTRHDDHADGKRRLFAYVLNLTPRWSADWGGLLAFIDGDGHVAEAYAPSFNALNVFAVPQPHAVTYVAPFAAGPRLSVTGWLRADPRPVPPAKEA